MVLANYILFHREEDMKKIFSLGLFCALSWFSMGFCKEEEGLSLARNFSKAFVEVGKRAIPAVVYIEAETAKRSSPRKVHPFAQRRLNPFADEFFRKFFGVNPEDLEEDFSDSSQVVLQKGSGFLVSGEGHILTNYHIIKGANKEKIHVILNDNRKYRVTLVGKDFNTDLAVLKIDSSESQEEFPHLTLGVSEQTEIGEWVIAIGTPFGSDFAETLTTGVVSGKGRNLDAYTPSDKVNLNEYIQTDAAINPGNSGGPLIDLEGKVVGINTAILSPHGVFSGLGFAIPSDTARKVLGDLIEKGQTEYGFMGISVGLIREDLKESFKERYGFEEGVEVIEVVKGGPADEAGILPQDIIVKIDGQMIDSQKKLAQRVQFVDPGTVVEVFINRKGKWKTFKVKLGMRPQASSPKEIAEDIGIEVTELTAKLKKNLGYVHQKGVIISRVARKFLDPYLKKGFLITEVEGREVESPEDFYHKVKEAQKNEKKYILLTITDGRYSRFVALPVN